MAVINGECRYVSLQYSFWTTFWSISCVRNVLWDYSSCFVSAYLDYVWEFDKNIFQTHLCTNNSLSDLGEIHSELHLISWLTSTHIQKKERSSVFQIYIYVLRRRIWRYGGLTGRENTRQKILSFGQFHWHKFPIVHNTVLYGLF